jgi:hypothetical protein
MRSSVRVWADLWRVALGGIYLGGGLNYWLRERFGIRFEVRHHVWPGGDGTIHLAGVRFGVVFGYCAS